MKNNKEPCWLLKLIVDKSILIIPLCFTGYVTRNFIKKDLEDMTEKFTNERRERINKNFTNHDITIQCIFQIISKIADKEPLSEIEKDIIKRAPGSIIPVAKKNDLKSRYTSSSKNFFLHRLLSNIPQEKQIDYCEKLQQESRE